MDVIISCPHCKNILIQAENKSKLKCHKCTVSFDVKEGIPVLIPKNMEPLQN